MGIPFEQRNFQKELDKKIAGFQKDGIVPTLLLHSCCAPCSSHCIEYLSDYFHITVFYYNPNISAEEEYRKRVEEQKRFISEFPAKYKVSFIEGDYDTKEFYDMDCDLQPHDYSQSSRFFCTVLSCENPPARGRTCSISLHFCSRFCRISRASMILPRSTSASPIRLCTR